MTNWQSLFEQNTQRVTGDSPGMVLLDDYCLFTVEGPEAASFLQGQLTCDIEALEEKTGNYCAHCNPKGRMLSSFVVSQLSDTRFVLRANRAVYETASKQLNKYMVFSKAELQPQTQWRAVGFLGEHIEALLKKISTSHAFIALNQIDTKLVECWFDTTQLSEISTYLTNLPLSDINTWRREYLRRGLIDIDEKMVEKYLPQELNFDKTGAISFKKGCYTGQEVIARLHYKGKLKKTMQLGRLNQALTPKYGTQIIDPTSHRALGHVLTSVKSENTGETLVLALTDSPSATNDAITDSKPSAKIEWLQLPYAIP